MTLSSSMPIHAAAATSGPPPQPDAAQIELALRKLGVVGSVLYVAAHPDDENTNLLAYLGNERLLHTAYLSLTRGDGGQNLIGAEQGTELGVIRTQELLAARRIDGAEQLFTRARDFGYSKNPEETLRIWGKDAVLTDVVLALRRFRPDVVITRFSPEPSETHGHHTASAELALAAFHAAADPAVHPEQLTQSVRPWQARRIYWNRSAWSIKPDDDLSDFLKLDVDPYNPLLGMSYGEMAAESRSMHKSQGFGVARTRGPVIEYFKLLDHDGPDRKGKGIDGVLDGIDFTWKRIKGGSVVARLVARAQREFDPAAPYKIIPTLVQIDKALDGIADGYWRDKKRDEVRSLLVACAGLFVEATAADYRVVPGQSIAVEATALNRSPAAITFKEVRFVGGAGAGEVVRVDKALGHAEVKKQVQVTLPLSTPYWLALPPEPGLFRVKDLALANLPIAPAELRVEFLLDVAGHEMTVRRPVLFKWTDPVAGERYRQVEITPLVSVRPSTPMLVTSAGEARPLSVRLSAALPAAGTLHVQAPSGWSVSPPAQPFALSDKDAQVDLAFRVQPPAGRQDAPARGTLHVVAQVGAQTFSQGVVHIQHEHIPVQVVLRSSDVDVVAMPIERAVRNIGYVQGPGDQVAADLRQIGYDVHELDEASLTRQALSGFDAVVIGVRAFNTKDKLRAAHPVLMGYVEGGGTLVVQYNTNNRLAPLSIQLGPYPFTIGSERVTDETAAVTVTIPGHRLLQWPNLITPRDFDGWVQERGLYFARTWDAHYETPMRMNDPGESPLDGSVLFAHFGKGVFIYTGLSFFRQLPAGVPGAYRLFANMLAAGQAHHAP
jgi:LmbE family N-acetylglucosaminyl deacetylase